MEPARSLEHAPATGPAPASQGPTRRWDRRLLRVTQAVAVLLLGAWLALLTFSVLEGHRASSYDDLRAAIRDGDVSAVEVSPGLRGRGSVTVRITWREGWVDHTTTVIEASPRRPVPNWGEVSAVLR
ncbi:hypothetical protein [Nocardioides sp. zg-DK7169]|uniref:hypothetical protein n=1 Tax=Nocardioides sp. zg-DK7169 TaxID=2736600 RepID=UPI00155471FC|nr:hypothetical protein [Nocardioides sp. zg-DK7169]NPC98979.1 hypothetical protein [Nocardioides sp. zg-DK7169]